MGVTGRITVVGSPDKGLSLLRFKANAEPLYVSQPLVETGHINESDWQKILASIVAKYPNIVVLVHPKLPAEYFGDMPTISLSQINSPYYCSRLVGHFSSVFSFYSR